MYKRAEYQLIRSRLEESRRFIQVVMGARQIGKSTVVKQVLKDIAIPHQLFSADNVPATNNAWISNCWAAVRSLKESNGWESAVLVIDEIQKISNWSEVIKRNGTTIRFMIVTSRYYSWEAAVFCWRKACRSLWPEDSKKSE